MKVKKSVTRVVSALMTLCLSVGCTGYNRVVMPPDERWVPIEGRQKVVVLYQGADEFYLTDVEIANDRLEATAREFPAWLTPKKDHRLHIYVDGTVAIPGTLPAKVSIPFTAVERVEVYYVSLGKSIIYTTAITAACVVAFWATLFAIAFAGGSCPFIYAFDGSSYEFEGEIYAGATFPPLERHDYLPLPNLNPVDGEYRVKLANELREIQHTNLTELLVIDHPAGAEVLVDKYGVPHTLTEPRSPAEAVTLKGEDVTAVVAAADDAPYAGDVIDEVNDDVDGVVLTFPRPREASAAKLVVQGKNSLWLDYVFGEFCKLFGDAYGDWYEGKGKEPPEKFHRWLFEQGIPLAVYVDDGGEWRFVDYFHVVGPISAKRCVLPLDLGAAASDEVRVKLEFGPLFWEIDYVALDFSADLPMQIRGVPPASAVDESGRDVSEPLRADDGRYYVQAEVGEYAFLTFPAPAPAEGMARTTVLHSKGHYEVLRNPQGKPDPGLLYSFKKPGRFVEFSQELFLNIYRDTVTIED